MSEAQEWREALELTSLIVARILSIRLLTINVHQSERRRSSKRKGLGTLLSMPTPKIAETNTNLEKIIRVQLPKAFPAPLDLRLINLPPPRVTI